MTDVAAYGFKVVTVENFDQPDPLSASHATRVGSMIRPMTAADLVGPLSDVVLSDAVPSEVHRAFLFARGAIGYAFFYYPLATIGAQQMLRVADYASDAASRANGLKRITGFGPRLGHLVKRGVIAADRADRWEAFRKARNRATHPPWQETWGFAHAVEITRAVATEIDALRWPPAEGDVAGPSVGAGQRE